jgi:hypothetical protein
MKYITIIFLLLIPKFEPAIAWQISTFDTPSSYQKSSYYDDLDKIHDYLRPLSVSQRKEFLKSSRMVYWKTSYISIADLAYLINVMPYQRDNDNRGVSYIAGYKRGDCFSKTVLFLVSIRMYYAFEMKTITFYDPDSGTYHICIYEKNPEMGELLLDMTHNYIGSYSDYIEQYGYKRQHTLSYSQTIDMINN